MMATLAFVKKWSVNLLGRHFQIKTDHYSLKFLLDQKANTTAQQAWIIKMMGYNYEVVFKKSSSNTVVDVLSRKPQATLYAISIVTCNLLQRIKHSWVNDASLVHLLHKLKHSSDTNSKYSWHGDQLLRKGSQLLVKMQLSRKSCCHHFTTVLLEVMLVLKLP